MKIPASMKVTNRFRLLRSALALAALVFCAGLPLAAEDGAEAPVVTVTTGEDIMRIARNSLYNQDAQMTGRLRPGGITFRQVPFQISVFEREIKFGFYKDDKSKNPIDKVVSLNLKDNRYELREIVKGKNDELPLERYGEKIRGTDVTFEDISMRFLYWPDSERQPDEKVGGVVGNVNAWVVVAKNPIETGPYRKVRVWVDQGSGAALKIEGYDAKDRMKKRFQVKGVQRDGDGGWVPDTVRVESFDPETGKNTSDTVMEFDKPK
jgi:hypothetical protein